MDLLTFVIGAGILAVLWRISQSLGRLSADMHHAMETLRDHESRIRTVERFDN